MLESSNLDSVYQFVTLFGNTAELTVPYDHGCVWLLAISGISGLFLPIPRKSQEVEKGLNILWKIPTRSVNKK